MVINKADIQDEAHEDPVIPAKIYHAKCAFNPIGVSESVCITTSGNLARNQTCYAKKCTSPARACWACLRDGFTFNASTTMGHDSEVAHANEQARRVKNPILGLCEFHLVHGKDVKRSDIREEKGISLPEPKRERRPTAGGFGDLEIEKMLSSKVAAKKKRGRPKKQADVPF